VSNLQELLTPQATELAKQIGYAFGMRQSGVLLPYQQRWVADTSKVK